MRVVFAGTPAAAVPSLRAVLASRHEVVGVLTRTDAPAGRGRGLRPSPVREVADEAGIPVLAPRSLLGPEVEEQLRHWAPQACPVVAYGLLVPSALLTLPQHGWVNLHFSLLPAWRGAAPVQHALRAGDDVSGAVTFRLEEGLDTGPVLGRLTETVRPRDTAGELLDRLAEAGAHLLVSSLDALEEGAVQPVPQPAEGVSLAPKVEVDDARVPWTLPAFAVDRLVRSCTPEPGAWTVLGEDRVKLGPVTPVDDAEPAVPMLEPGQVDVRRRDVLVGTGSSPVRLGDVQAPGKRAMPATDWARGARLQPGATFDA
ncbi:methionyl-tRNA formyltransferase [uncultured Serinicoccus sp.]|uniref:methionyl-tRNA formyltransferase n=1 Tax=uncultured Serinicoccus sp. TaxID=735514 RepID=UPI0026267518|nr:methionyl-tRNA formyltransferase [uncultured Serinicoccus sp.]